MYYIGFAHNEGRDCYNIYEGKGGSERRFKTSK